MGYREYRTLYMRVLGEFLAEPAHDTVQDQTRQSRVLSARLAELEETHPLWTERIEDELADRMLRP